MISYLCISSYRISEDSWKVVYTFETVETNAYYRTKPRLGHGAWPRPSRSVSSLKELLVLSNSWQNMAQRVLDPGKQNLQIWGTQTSNFIKLPGKLLCVPYVLKPPLGVEFSASMSFPHLLTHYLILLLHSNVIFLQCLYWFIFLSHWTVHVGRVRFYIVVGIRSAPSSMPGTLLSNKHPNIQLISNKYHSHAWINEWKLNGFIPFHVLELEVPVWIFTTSLSYLKSNSEKKIM